MSSRSSDSELSLMSPKRRCIDDTSVMSPRRDSSDHISLQAKEVIFSLYLYEMTYYLSMWEIVSEWSGANKDIRHIKVSN